MVCLAVYGLFGTVRSQAGKPQHVIFVTGDEEYRSAGGFNLTNAGFGGFVRGIKRPRL